jgi:hypothetical protein
MIVVADTTPLNHLILIDHASALKALYGRVIIPQAILSELQHEATPPRVEQWISNRPDWLEVKYASLLADPTLAHLDASGLAHLLRWWTDGLDGTKWRVLNLAETNG